MTTDTETLAERLEREADQVELWTRTIRPGRGREPGERQVALYREAAAALRGATPAPTLRIRDATVELPPTGKLVMVAGGLAWWNRRWFTASNGYPIEWTVEWWVEIPVEPSLRAIAGEPEATPEPKEAKDG